MKGKWKRTCLGIALCALGNLGALEIVRDGQSDFVIVTPADATAAEITAAAELQTYIAKMTRVTLPIQNQPQTAGGNLIVGGAAGFAETGSEAWETKADSVILKVRGDDVWIGGARPRGALYAVYTLLEEFWGVRFYAPGEEFLPQTESLSLEDTLSYCYAPPFFYRETHYGAVNTNPDFAAKLKSNGHFQTIPPEWGGNLRLGEPGFVHTVTLLAPPAKHFASHPEWYALDEHGKRDPAQVCWSNPEMRAELTRAVLAQLAAQPETKILSVSQMDGWLRCRCERCGELEAAGASPAAPMLAAVNAVAAKVAEEYPGVWLDTLAYVYSQTPPAPSQVSAAENVLVRLCAYQNDFSRPYDSEVNAVFRDDLKNWRQVAGHLAIWDYIANFTNYLIPHPNLGTFGANIRLFAENNVTSVFSQGDIGSAGCGDFVQLKAWVIAHLLWNPALDERALTVEFLNGYYSPEAGKRLLAVIDRVRQSFQASGRRLGCYHADVNDWLTQETIAELRQSFFEAEKLLPEKDRAIYAERLRRARLPFDLAALCTPEASAWNLRLTEAEYLENLALWDEVRALYEQYGVTELNEITPIAALYERMPRWLAGPKALRRSGETPEFCREPAQWYEFSVDDVELLKKGDWTQVEDSAESPFGRVARLPNARGEWLLTLPLPDKAICPENAANRWRVAVRLRAVGEGDPAAEAVRIGCYDATGGGAGGEKTWTLREFSDGFVWKMLDGIELTRRQQIYVAPLTEKWRGEIVVDRVILLRETVPPETEGGGQ